VNTQGIPLRVAVREDYELVVQGLSAMLSPYRARVRVAPSTDGAIGRRPPDIELFDPAGREPDLDRMVRETRARRVVVFSWQVDDVGARAAVDAGAAGYVGKWLPAEQLVGALERIHRGEVVVSEAPGRDVADAWPGRMQGLTHRESQVMAMIAQGLSNQDIADQAFLSINTVKSYIRSSYRKLDITSRSRAVLWGIEHVTRPDQAPAAGQQLRATA
jgi:NarL family two-component system response regulator LiaR